MSNSAARLLNVMDKLNVQKPAKKALLDLTSRVSFTGDQDFITSATLTEVYNLLHNTIADVKAVPNIDHELYLDWVPHVTNGLFSLSLVNNNPVNSIFSQYYTAVQKKSLQFCAHELNKIRSKPVFSEKERSTIYEQASILQENVMVSKDLDPQMKTFISDKLEAILNAIAYYNFSGDKRIIEVTESAVGACVMQPAFKNSENRNTSCAELIQLLAKIMTTVVTADGFYKISANIITTLLN